MFGRIRAALFAILLAGCASTPVEPAPLVQAALPADQQAFVDKCEPWDGWDKPAPPFRIHGSSYYVGTCGIAAILIAGADGHVLIDTGTERGGDVVLNNIRRLGFEPSDVELILSSHEHFDHVGAMAKVQRATGAMVVSSTIGAEVMRTGEDHPQDPQYGLHPPMEPVPAAMAFDEAPSAAMLAKHAIRPVPTPGHTPGAMSWLWTSCEGDDCKVIVFADSLSPVSRDEYRFSDHPAYVAQYRAGLEELEQTNCDVLLAPHPSHARLIRMLSEGTLLSQDAPCHAYAQIKRDGLSERLAKEAES